MQSYGSHNISRYFIIYFLLTIITIVCGLLSRTQLIPLPTFVTTYAGDTLWALAVYLGLAVAFPKTQTKHLFVFALTFSFLIEFSQFYQASWINTIRNTFLGGLVLGFGFQVSDLVCYTIGVLSGAIIDLFLLYYVNAYHGNAKSKGRTSAN